MPYRRDGDLLEERKNRRDELDDVCPARENRTAVNVEELC